MATFALIPSYQPDERLVGLVAQVRAQGLEPVVVDDGSGEEYRACFDPVRAHATVIGSARNRGKGQALKRGLALVQQRAAAGDIVVTMDADGQHALDDVLRCVVEARAHPDALVLGCRSFDGAGVPLRSRMGNKITRGIYRLASGVRLSDTQTGLRAFSARLIPFLLQVEGARYEYEMNVLLACPQQGIALREVPIQTIYEDGNACSHFRPLRDSARIYGGILGFAASSLASFGIDYLLFWLLSGLCASLGSWGVALANVGARLVSATVNFLINRRLVFRSRESLYTTTVRYALLAMSILLGNTCLMVLLTSAGVPARVAKLTVELLFFVASWVLQSRVVFQRRYEALPEAFPTRARVRADRTMAVASRVYPGIGQGVRATAATKGGATMARHATRKKARAGFPLVGVYATLLALCSVYVLLDTFVITRSYARVKEAVGVSAQGADEETEQDETDRLIGEGTTTSDAEASGAAEGTNASGEYQGIGSVQASLSQTRYLDTTIYVVDVYTSDVTQLLAALADDTYGKNVTAKTSQIAADNDALVAINGDYYGARNAGYVVRNGVLYRDVAASADQEDLVIYRDGTFSLVREGEVSAEELVDAGAWQVFSFGPGLVDGGVVCVDAEDEVGRAMASNPRTAIGRVSDGHYVLVVSDGRTSESEGLSLQELATYMVDELGVECAYNLDGGGSSTLYFDGEVVNNPTTSGRSVKERSVSDIVYLVG